jgi:hypothetical protein
MTHPVAIALTAGEQRLLVRLVREHLAREDSPQAADVLEMLENALDARAVPGFFSETVPERIEGLGHA